ncbi:hypothetical protein M409DRAFT_65541 [Zasmidium cellare ATCC 36951]|uniref:Chromatin modification-related protein n=1 Tax=Zasmidium cellare ATCC 36951 TaxID=1080233 RepID=A0A6A6CSC9_ZASCE|nr:uncharacterized protein M409DRAFT_65541 [Zasmidium cellare ATCC 36951]KAF2168669.1 hypothetical protein M409DRAFT_65541 [Zasmidium cellare ATCC 36951]
MSLANPEDAASVLEQFVHDVANIPAEVTHLMEEIQAKDLQIAAFEDEINKRDAQLQKWVRVNGGHVQNPKEEAFSKTINDCYDKCEVLQAAKCGLAEKALLVLERQLKRFDLGIRGLTQTEQFPADWPGPSMLTSSGAATAVSTPIAAGGSGVTPGMPLQVVSGNIGSTGGAPNIANAAQIRLAQQAAGGTSRSASAGGQTPNAPARSQREGSIDASRRKKFNQSLSNLPAGPSRLRQSSLGPGTPKAGTPGPGTSSRAGSAQPSRPGGVQKSQPVAVNRKAPPASKKSGHRARPPNKKDRRRQLARDRATPSTNASLSGSDDDDSASPTPSSLPRSQQDGSGDRADDEDGDDENLYCICQKVSYGEMVGCDNDDCELQWFHYKCVGVTEEPKGEWLCPNCRTLPKNKLKISKN